MHYDKYDSQNTPVRYWPIGEQISFLTGALTCFEQGIKQAMAADLLKIADAGEYEDMRREITRYMGICEHVWIDATNIDAGILGGVYCKLCGKIKRE